MPSRMRILALIDGAGTGTHLAAISIILASQHGVARTGTVLAFGSLGRIAALAWTGALTRNGTGAEAARRAYLLATILMTVGSSAGLVAAGYGSLPAVALLGIIGGTGNNVTSTLAATARKGQMTAFYPLLMVGAAAGSVTATFILQHGLPTIILHLIILAQLLEPLLLRPYQRGLTIRPAASILATDLLRASILSACAYGPLAVYAALVTTSIGSQYVGAAMVTYSAGAALAPRAERLLQRHLQLKDRLSTVSALAAAGVATWVAAGTVPGLLGGRLAAGTLMFLAQGMLLRMSFESSGGSEARVASGSAGLGLGAGLGGIIAALIAENAGLAAMAAILAGATLAAGLIGERTQNRRPHR